MPTRPMARGAAQDQIRDQLNFDWMINSASHGAASA
jgi:hypothetical protein